MFGDGFAALKKPDGINYLLLTELNGLARALKSGGITIKCITEVGENFIEFLARPQQGAIGFPNLDSVVPVLRCKYANDPIDGTDVLSLSRRFSGENVIFKPLSPS